MFAPSRLQGFWVCVFICKPGVLDCATPESAGVRNSLARVMGDTWATEKRSFCDDFDSSMILRPDVIVINVEIREPCVYTRTGSCFGIFRLTNRDYGQEKIVLRLKLFDAIETFISIFKTCFVGDLRTWVYIAANG